MKPSSGTAGPAISFDGGVLIVPSTVALRCANEVVRKREEEETEGVILHVESMSQGMEDPSQR